MSTSPIGTRVPALSPNSIIRAGIPLSDNFNATDVAVTVESLLSMIPPGTIGVQSVTGDAVDNTDPANPVVDIASGVFTSAYDNLVQISAPAAAYTGAWTRIGENISYGVQLTGDLSLAQTSGSFTITLPEIVNNLGNDNISFIIGTYDNVTGNEKAIIYPNIGALTATIEIEGYTAASTFFLFVNAIYKR
jgi:hypothetical protein